MKKLPQKYEKQNHNLENVLDFKILKNQDYR